MIKILNANKIISKYFKRYWINIIKKRIPNFQFKKAFLKLIETFDRIEITKYLYLSSSEKLFTRPHPKFEIRRWNEKPVSASIVTVNKNSELQATYNITFSNDLITVFVRLWSFIYFDSNYHSFIKYCKTPIVFWDWAQLLYN